MVDFFTTYSRHYARMGNVVPDYNAIIANPNAYALDEEWLPDDKNSAILDVGAGWGMLLAQLAASGFRNLTGIEHSKSQYDMAKLNLPSNIEFLFGDGHQVLSRLEKKFALITIFDVVEHLSLDKAVELLIVCKRQLQPDGKIVIRVPNMANIFAPYSRYMDITHVMGYTEWSLFQLLDASGFSDHKVVVGDRLHWKQWKRHRSLTYPWRGLGVKGALNRLFHEVFFMLRGQHPRPSTYTMNLTVSSVPAE